MEGNSASSSTASADEHSSAWECHICMQLPTDPVATSCGHIFCWPCIYRWLRDGPRPCPACRTHLNKDRNILPIYGGGARAGPSISHGNGDGDGDGNSSAVAIAASDHVIPPRPRNPLFFVARLEGPASTHEAEDTVWSRVRARVHRIIQERAASEHRASESELRNCELRREAQEGAVRHMQETFKLRQDIGRLQWQIVQKDGMLGRANGLLPPGWSDGI